MNTVTAITLFGYSISLFLAFITAVSVGLGKTFFPRRAPAATQAAALLLATVLKVADYFLTTGSNVSGLGFEHAAITGFLSGGFAIVGYHAATGDVLDMLTSAFNSGNLLSLGNSTISKIAIPSVSVPVSDQTKIVYNPTTTVTGVPTTGVKLSAIQAADGTAEKAS